MKSKSIQSGKQTNGQADLNYKTASIPEGYITSAELAARLRKHLSTVNLLIRQRSIPYYKIGRHVRFKWSEVDTQLQRHCRIAPKRPLNDSTL